MNSAELAAYLDSVLITGAVGTDRQDNLHHMRLFLEGNEHLGFGVRTTREWTFDDVFDLMHERVGIDPDRSHLSGQDTIDSAKCVAALDRFAAVFGAAVAAGQRILFATGHPAGLLPVHAALAAAAPRPAPPWCKSRRADTSGPGTSGSSSGCWSGTSTVP